MVSLPEGVGLEVAAKPLEGSVALVTGAARGMGRSHCLKLASDGADIVALDVGISSSSSHLAPASKGELEETVELVRKVGRRALAFYADVRSQAEMDAAVAAALSRFEGVDIVVANAGVLHIGMSWRLSEEEWREAIDVNLTGVWHTFKAVLPSMLERKRGGCIVVISSVAGIKTYPGISAYVAAKHGASALALAVASEVGAEGIRVNVLAPTSTDTEMQTGDAARARLRPDLANPTRENVAEVLAQAHLLRTPWLETQDVSNALAWLCSPAARYVTGAVLPIDAGARLK
jgi:SDR family mycofactocin-dependent oxidoreductase